jgi:hypothetical protein
MGLPFETFPVHPQAGLQQSQKRDAHPLCPPCIGGGLPPVLVVPPVLTVPPVLVVPPVGTVPPVFVVPPVLARPPVLVPPAPPVHMPHD